MSAEIKYGDERDWPAWVDRLRLRPGMRVRLSAAGRAAGLKPRKSTGTVTEVYALSSEYIGVRLDGQKREGCWASVFWEPEGAVEVKGPA